MSGGTGTNISQFLPANVRAGLVNTPTAASAANYYLTLADLTGGGGIYGGSGSLVTGTTTVSGATSDRLEFVGPTVNFTQTVGGNTVTSGTGSNPAGFGAFGQATLINTTSNHDAYFGVLASGGNPVLQGQIYDNTTFVENACFFVGMDDFSGTDRPYFAGYYTSDNVAFTGFQADIIGEQLYTQRLGLVATALAGTEGIMFVNSTGYLKAATLADLASNLPIDTLYTASGTTVSNTNVTVTDELTFLTPTNNDRVLIGPVGFTGLNNFHFRSINGNGAHFDANNNSGSGYVAKFRNFDGVSTYSDVVRFRGSGQVDLAINGARTNMGNTAVRYAYQLGQEFQQFSSADARTGFHANNNGNAQIAMRATSANTVSSIDSTGNLVIGVGWSGNFAGGPTANNNILISAVNNGVAINAASTTITPDGMFHVRGAGNSNATRMVTFEGNAGNDRLLLQDDGQFNTGSGTNALASATYGQTHRTSGYTNGIGFFPINPTNGVVVNAQGTVTNGLFVPLQSNAAVSIVRAGLFDNKSVGGSNHAGVYGFARNGSVTSVGLDGLVGGGSSVAASLYIAGLRGGAASNLDEKSYGALVSAQYNNAGLSYTSDMIGIEAVANGVSGAAGSTGDIIGGMFRTTGLAGTGDRIALLVPQTNNNGVVVLGADNFSGAANSFLEVAGGDIRMINSADGLVLKDRTTGLFQRFYLDNGNLQDEAA